jgi:hypothetical protein
MSTISASTVERDLVVFQVHMKDNHDIGSSTSFVRQSCIDTAKIHMNDGGFTIAANGITFPETGYYAIGCSLYYIAATASDTNKRVSPEMKFYNQTQSANLVGSGSIAGMAYCRNLTSSGYSGPRRSSSMITQIAQVSANDVIAIYTRRSSSNASQGVEMLDNSIMWGFKLQ